MAAPPLGAGVPRDRRWRSPSRPAPPPPPTGPSGSIYDIGYRGYDGPRLGRRHAFTTLFVGGSGRRSDSADPGGRRSCRGSTSSPGDRRRDHRRAHRVPVRFGIGTWGCSRSRRPRRPDWCLHHAPRRSPAAKLLGRDAHYRVLSLYFSRALLRPTTPWPTRCPEDRDPGPPPPAPLHPTIGARCSRRPAWCARPEAGAGRRPSVRLITAVAAAGVALMIAAFVGRATRRWHLRRLPRLPGTSPPSSSRWSWTCSPVRGLLSPGSGARCRRCLVYDV